MSSNYTNQVETVVIDSNRYKELGFNTPEEMERVYRINQQREINRIETIHSRLSVHEVLGFNTPEEMEHAYGNIGNPIHQRSTRIVEPQVERVLIDVNRYQELGFETPEEMERVYRNGEN